MANHRQNRSRTHIKICGITRRNDALAACEFGADAVGFVLWPGSKRHIELPAAADIIKKLPEGIQSVGVLVSPTVDDVRQVYKSTGVTAAQLCGPLPEGDWRILSNEIALWRSLPVMHGVGPTRQKPYFNDYMFDTSVKGLHGGTGQTFDWHAIGEAMQWGRGWVAGGLDADNVGDAIEAVRPYGVDVSTGVESSPGIKDHDRMRAFCDAVRKADMTFHSA